MTLAELIRLTRQARGVTLRALEASSGISNAMISQIETGWIDDMSFRNAAKLAKALGISLDELVKTKPVKRNRKNASKMRGMR
jgi:transcriptional regulator with XRE-family HTH domain